MREIELVFQLSNLYGFNVDEALILTGLNNKEKVPCDNFKNNVENKVDTVKPFDGIIKEDCCKAVVYNHGLYTQCTNKCNKEFCSSVCKKLKYGHINVRKNYPVGTYVLECGKCEISYQKVKKRLDKKSIIDKKIERIITNDSDTEEESDVKLEVIKNSRGRPKMSAKEIEINIDTREEKYTKNCNSEDEDSNIEEILVRRETIHGIEYLVSENNIVFDNKTLKMIGKKVLGKIEKVKIRKV